MLAGLVAFWCIFISITTLLGHRNTATTKKSTLKIHIWPSSERLVIASPVITESRGPNWGRENLPGDRPRETAKTRHTNHHLFMLEWDIPSLFWIILWWRHTSRHRITLQGLPRLAIIIENIVAEKNQLFRLARSSFSYSLINKIKFRLRDSFN